MTTRKPIDLTIQKFVGKVMSLLFNTLSRFVIAFLSRNKHLGVIRVVSSAYLRLSTSCNMPGWMKLKLESRLPGEVSITSDMQMTLP